jgi:ATP-dependent exoDNAse (exonuclease V) alpha subunit
VRGCVPALPRTIEHAGPERLTVRLDDGRAVAFHPDEYKDIAHGYAVTIHKSQGATVDRTVLSIVAVAISVPLISDN